MKEDTHRHNFIFSNLVKAILKDWISACADIDGYCSPNIITGLIWTLHTHET